MPTVAHRRRLRKSGRLRPLSDRRLQGRKRALAMIRRSLHAVIAAAAGDQFVFVVLSTLLEGGGRRSVLQFAGDMTSVVAGLRCAPPLNQHTT